MCTSTKSPRWLPSSSIPNPGVHCEPVVVVVVVVVNDDDDALVLWF